MAVAVDVMITDVGIFPMPPDMIPRFKKAKKRKNGDLDRRYREGKTLRQWERDFCAQKLKEWTEGKW